MSSENSVKCPRCKGHIQILDRRVRVNEVEDTLRFKNCDFCKSGWVTQEVAQAYTQEYAHYLAIILHSLFLVLISVVVMAVLGSNSNITTTDRVFVSLTACLLGIGSLWVIATNRRSMKYHKAVIEVWLNQLALAE